MSYLVATWILSSIVGLYLTITYALSCKTFGWKESVFSFFLIFFTIPTLIYWLFASRIKQVLPTCTQHSCYTTTKEELAEDEKIAYLLSDLDLPQDYSRIVIDTLLTSENLNQKFFGSLLVESGINPYYKLTRNRLLAHYDQYTNMSNVDRLKMKYTD